MSITTKERELYSDVWHSIAGYGEYSPGELCLPFFLQMVGEQRGTVLDAGCGSGKGSLALVAKDFDVTLCDLTRAGLVPAAEGLPFIERSLWDEWPTGIEWDWVYCCDVLEHIPTPFTMLVVRQLLSVARRGVFLSISLMPDNLGVLIGKTLHHTVQTFPQWRDQLNTVGHCVEARDLLGNALFLVEKR